MPDGPIDIFPLPTLPMLSLLPRLQSLKLVGPFSYHSQAAVEAEFSKLAAILWVVGASKFSIHTVTNASYLSQPTVCVRTKGLVLRLLININAPT